MAGKERKLIAASTGTLGVTGDITATIAATESMENFHNMWISVSCEPQDAAANGNGQWCLYAQRSPKRSTPNASIASITDDENQDIIVAFGTWMAANESPFNSNPIRIGNVSRNIPKLGELVLKVHVEGVSAGLVRMTGFVTCNTRTI